MKYVKVEWNHDLPGEPIVIFSEVNDQGWEIRKIELFGDGAMISADAHHGLLAEVRFPDELSDITHAGGRGEFAASQISGREFDAMWQASMKRDAMLSHTG